MASGDDTLISINGIKRLIGTISISITTVSLLSGVIYRLTLQPLEVRLRQVEVFAKTSENYNKRLDLMEQSQNINRDIWNKKLDRLEFKIDRIESWLTQGKP